MDTKEYKLTDLHVQVTHEQLISDYVTMDKQKQKDLQDKIKLLAKDFLLSLDAPMLVPKQWNEAQIEILTEGTVQFIDSMVSILEELQGDPDTSDDILERIDAILK